MSVFTKSTIKSALAEIEPHYKALLAVMEGRPVDREVLMMMNIDPRSDHAKELVSVDVEDVLNKLAFFKTAIDNLRRINQRAMRKT